MSDGPWRSLPLRPHWKQVAKRAENGAYSLEETFEARDAALLKEAKELPLEAVLSVVLDGQGVLLGPDLDGKLEEIGRGHPGSALVQTFISCLRNQLAGGSSGREMVESAVSDTLRECALDHFRAIQEHYYRKSQSPTVDVRHRLESAYRACDFRELASRLVAPSGSSASPPRPAKRSGLDDGPRL